MVDNSIKDLISEYLSVKKNPQAFNVYLNVLFLVGWVLDGYVLYVYLCDAQS